jgi:DNA-binding SARP family transcriptional activator
VIGFSVLGPLEAIGDRGPIALGGPKQRALLGLLLVNANRVVSTDEIADALWGERAPPTAASSLQNLVARLRRAIGPDRLQTCPPGYKLAVEPDELDLSRFEQLVAAARAAAPADRVPLLDAALGLVRGEPLADLAYEGWAFAEAHRLEELVLSAVEDRLSAKLELGVQAETVADLEALVTLHPLRERLRGLLMLALYRSGRQAEAVAAYQEARHALVEELGIDPSPELQELYKSILRQERKLQAAAAAVDEDHHGTVARAILAGRVVPVLGPGVGVAGGEGRSASHELVERLAQVFAVPAAACDSLASACEYVALTSGAGALYDELHEAVAATATPGPVHRFLAALPPLLRERGVPHQLIVAAGFDDATERAFADVGEELDVVSYLAVGRHRGRFVHAAPGEGAVVVAEPNAYGGLSLERRTVLLKIHGSVDASPERPWESFVASEDDYLDFLADVELTNLVPVTLAARLRRSHFLFLAYSPVREWSLRVFLHHVFGLESIRYRSWAVDPAPGLLARELWAERAVELYAVPLERYLEELSARLEVGVVPA